MERITSPPYDTAKITSPRIYELVHVGYCSLSEFHFWLLSEREDFQNELELTSTDVKKLFQAKQKFTKWRKKYANAVEASRQPQGRELREATIQELGQKMDRELSRILDSAKRKRLFQLANQLMLSRNDPLAVKKLLPAYVRKDDLESALRMSQSVTGSNVQFVKEEFYRIRRELEEPPQKLVLDWLLVGLDEKKIRWLRSELDLQRFRPVNAQEYSHLGQLDQYESELKDGLSFGAAWRKQSAITLSATGVYRVKIEESKAAAITSLLLNCAYDARFRGDLSMTGSQAKDAERLLENIKGGTDLSPKKFLANFLLPHQLTALEERTVWRELEIYGLLPCLLHGRLRDKLNLTDENRSKMIAEAPLLHERLKKLDKEIWTSDLGVWEELFHSLGHGELFDETFGEPPSIGLFPRSKIL